MEIKSLYMPDTCLQNVEFPAHILWDKNEKIEITLTLPNFINLKNIYNVPEEGIVQSDENTITIKQFDIEGYVGFVFNSQILETSSKIAKIKFKIHLLKTDKQIEEVKEIVLFRPEIVVEFVPKEMYICHNPKTHKIEIDNKIHLINRGDGTAHLGVDVFKESDFKRSFPEGVGNFIKGFVDDLERKLNALKPDYPDYEELIDKFVSLRKNPSEFNDETRNAMKEVDEKIFDIVQDDEKFGEKFALCIIQSILANIQLITEIKSFLDYINSAGEDRILVINALEIVKIPSVSGILHLKLFQTDLAKNEYPEIELPPIKVTCDKVCQIPIYTLFQWGNSKN